MMLSFTSRWIRQIRCLQELPWILRRPHRRSICGSRRRCSTNLPHACAGLRHRGWHCRGLRRHIRLKRRSRAFQVRCTWDRSVRHCKWPHPIVCRSQSHLHQWPCPWDHPCGRIRRGKHRHRCTFQGKLTGCRSRRPFNCLPWGNPCTNHGWHRMSRLGRLWAAQGWHRRPRLDTLRNAVASRRAQCFEQQGN